MRFENRFDVDAPLERVWEAMLDVERVAPTVPGAQVLDVEPVLEAPLAS